MSNIIDCIDNRAMAIGVVFLAIVFAVSPIVLYLFEGVAFGRSVGLGDTSKVLKAFLNSMTFAIVISFLSCILVFVNIIFLRSFIPLFLFSIFSFFAPADVVALGYDRIARFLGDLTGLRSVAEIFSFCAAIFMFVIPFIAVSMVALSASVSKNQLNSMAELNTTRTHAFLRIFISESKCIGVSILLGIAIIFNESARTRILGGDFIGLGSQYFGPLVFDAHNSRNVDIFITFASIGLVPIVIIGFYKFLSKSRVA